MDDASSTPSVCRYKVAAKRQSGTTSMPFGQGYCHFCGRPGVIVSRFPRKGYGKRRHETASHYG
jgi:hypothetical protein